MSTISNYYYSPSTITNLLRKAVDTVEADIGCYCKSPGVDFTRKRKISFLILSTCLWKELIVVLTLSSLHITRRLIRCHLHLLSASAENCFTLMH